MARSSATVPAEAEPAASTNSKAAHPDARLDDQVPPRVVRHEKVPNRLWTIGSAVAAGLAAWR